MKIESACLAAAAAATCVLTGQAAAAADEPVEPRSVIVTATRYALPQDDVLPASIVIDREELQRSLATDIAEVLRTRAGLEFGRSGGIGQNASMFLRGTDSNHTLILVDGVRINPGTIGGAALQNISPQLVERIEVVKGPRSSLYGTDAIGGVVQIFTRASDGDGIATQASYGADATLSSSANAGWNSANSHLGLGVSYLETDGFAPLKADARGGAYDNLGVNLAASTGWETGSGGSAVDHKLGATYWRSAGSADYIGFSSRTFDNALFTQDYTNEAATVSYAWDLGAWQSRVEAGRMVDDLEQRRVQDALGTFDSPDFSTTRRNSVGWQNDFDLSDRQRLSAGVMYYDENSKTSAFGKVQTAITNLYLQDRLALGRHTLLLAGGYVDHEAFGDHATWNAEYGLQLGGATRLTAAAGTAFRAPDATDRFGFGGNPDLEPETSQNFELGLRHRIDARQRVFANAFDNRIDDLIEYFVTDPDTFDGELRNIQQARIRGIEAGYELDGRDWQLRAEAIYQQPENRTTGERLLRRAERNFIVSFVQRLGAAELGFDILAAGAREDFGGISMDSYVLADFTARYNFSSSWSAQARIENVLDEDYELASGYATPDRSLFVALRYTPSSVGR